MLRRGLDAARVTVLVSRTVRVTVLAGSATALSVTVGGSVHGYQLEAAPGAQAALDVLVADEGLSANEAINRAILDRAARHGLSADVREAFAQGAEHWADVLERLHLA